MEIDDWRDEIDRLDLQLVEFLNRRAQCAIEIGKIKHKLGLPVYSPTREAEVFNNVVTNNRGPLSNEAIKRLFERIIDEARSIERFMAGERIAAQEKIIAEDKKIDDLKKISEDKKIAEE